MKLIIGFIILTSIFGCEKQTENNKMNANTEIIKILKNHEYNPILKNGIIDPNFKENVTIESNIFYKDYNPNFGIQLDVVINLENGGKIIESFGDIGKDKSEALNNSLENFMMNDFHVITNSLNHISESNEITYEKWNINNYEYEVYIGNFGRKNEFNIPNGVFEKIEKIIKEQKFENEFHWMRFYYSNFDKKIMEIEFLIDNKKNTNAENEMKLIDWEKKEEFYSLRNFVIFKKVHNNQYKQ